MVNYAAHKVPTLQRSRQTKRERMTSITAQLVQDRMSFEAHWNELGEYITPRRRRKSTAETNDGTKKNNKIVDSTATISARTARSGMMSGITSPARRWFGLETEDVRLMDIPAAKAWCYQVAERMSKVFNRSNFYKTMPTVYGDMLVFGTGAMFVEESAEKIIRCTAFPVGTYWIGINAEGMADTFYREFSMTVRQIVDTFAYNVQEDEIDWRRVSNHIKEAYENGRFNARYDVCHMIKPNDEFNPKKLDAKYKKFSSTYYEKGTGYGNETGGYLTGVDADKYLRESGFDSFPVLVPRWEVAGEDSYATTCPGMETLGDIKQLQEGERKSLRAINKMIDPAMKGPTTLENKPVNLLPGGMTYTDEVSGGGKFEAAHTVNFSLAELEQKQEQVRNRIKDGFFENLWLMFTSRQPENPPTATQVQIQNDEKLLVLGPVLEQINQELERLIDITFRYMALRGLIPPPPPQLQGAQLNVTFVSVIAQAQKLVAISNLDRFLSTVVQLAAVNPEVMDTINTDQIIYRYADRLSIEPGLVKSPDEVQQVRGARQQQMAAAQGVENAQGAARAAKDVASIDQEKGNVLQQIFRQQAA